MAYFKVHLNDRRMMPWMVEQVFGRELWPGYHAHWSDLVTNRSWITYNSERNGAAFEDATNNSGAKIQAVDITAKVKALIGKAPPKPPKLELTEKGARYIREYLDHEAKIHDAEQAYFALRNYRARTQGLLKTQFGDRWEEAVNSFKGQV